MAKKALRMYQRLSKTSGMSKSKTFVKFVGRGVMGKYPDLKADLCDCLAQAGTVDPLPFLLSEARSVVNNPSQMFPSGVKNIGCKVKFTGADRADLSN